MSYEPEAPFDLAKVTTTEDLLKALRKGNEQVLELGLGALKVPCKLLSAYEEALIVAKAKQRARTKNPTGLMTEVFEAYEVMKDTLSAATTIMGDIALPHAFLEAINKNELGALYDQYQSLNHTINPNFQEMSSEEIGSIVEEIKKKGTREAAEQVANRLFTWQLARIGRLFLAEILPNLQTVSAPGSV